MTDPQQAEKHRIHERGRHAARKASQALVPVQPGEGGLAYVSRALPGGRASLIELARLSPHTRVKAVVQEWDSLTATKQIRTRLEVLCEGREIPPADFLGEVVKAAFEHNIDLGKLILAINTPRIVQRSVKEALTQKGFKDRQMLMEASGIAPKGGGGIHVHAEARAGAQAAVVVVPKSTPGLPSMEDDAILTTEAVRRDS